MKMNVKRTNFRISKASGSTETSKTMAMGTVVDTATKGVNENTNIMASMMTQMNSTKSIMIIVVIGLVAYMFFQTQKRK